MNCIHCIVTAGPTYEKLDEVRRLTNFSTGRLGTELAHFLTRLGHRVILLRGYYAVFQTVGDVGQVLPFTTTEDLRTKLQSLAAVGVGAVFHAAAVSDFALGKAFVRSQEGGLVEVQAGKLPTSWGALLVELVPTRKIIPELRAWFPQARLVGWKYEVDGVRTDAVRAATEQIERCRTDACVVNGPAYGEGFGLVDRHAECRHALDRQTLFEMLAKDLETQSPR